MASTFVATYRYNVTYSDLRGDHFTEYLEGGRYKYLSPLFSCPQKTNVEFHVLLDDSNRSLYLRLANPTTSSGEKKEAEKFKISFTLKVEANQCAFLNAEPNINKTITGIFLQ